MLNIPKIDIPDNCLEPETGLSENEIQILRHTTGLDYAEEPWRNHFYAGAGHSDIQTLERLVEKGLMKKQRDPLNKMDESFIFYCTPAGTEQAKISNLNKKEVA